MTEIKSQQPVEPVESDVLNATKQFRSRKIQKKRESGHKHVLHIVKTARAAKLCVFHALKMFRICGFSFSMDCLRQKEPYLIQNQQKGSY